MPTRLRCVLGAHGELENSGSVSNIWVYVQTEERTHEQVNIYGPRLKRGKKYVL